MMTQAGRDAHKLKRLKALDKANTVHCFRGDCPYCKGTGILQELYSVDRNNCLILDDPIFVECSVCDGTGLWDDPRRYSEDESKYTQYPVVTKEIRKKIAAMQKSARTDK